MMSRYKLIITAVLACHAFVAPPLVTSQSPGPCAPPPGSQNSEETTICALQQEKDGTVYKLHQHARIYYRSWILSADEMVYDSDSGNATAEGHVIVEGGPGDEHIEASRGTYNVQTEVGKFYDVTGTTGFRLRGRNIRLLSDNPFAFTGKLVEKTGPNHFVVHDGTVTSCQTPHPNWLFSAGRVEVETTGNARIYNSVFRIRGMPVLYFPYATHPVQKGSRQSGFFVPHVGRSSRKGFVAGESFYWAIDRSMDLTLGAEYYSLRGAAMHDNFRWRPSDASFLDLTYFGVFDRKGQGGENAHLNGEGPLPWGFRGVADIEYLSNYAFRQAFSETISLAVNSEVRSKLFLSKNSNGFFYNAEVGRYQNFQSTDVGDVVTILHAPGFEVSGVDHPLWNSPFLASFDGAVEGLSRSEPGFRTANLVGRFDFQPSVALPLHWQGWAFRPELTLRDTFYTHELLPSKSLGRATDSPLNRKALEATFDVRPPALERVFQKEVFGLKLKHVIEPSLTYRYTTGVSNFANILRFDSRDILSDTNELEVGFTQRLYAKSHKPPATDCHDTEGFLITGVQTESRSAKHPWQREDTRDQPCPKTPAAREIVSWRIAQKYFFDPTFGHALISGQTNVLASTSDFTGISFLTDPRRWSPIISRLRIQTTARSEAEWNLDYDFKKGRIDSSTVLVNYHFGDFTVGGSDYLLRTLSVLLSPNKPSPSEYHQFRALFGHGSPAKRGWSALTNFGFDPNADKGRYLQYGSVQTTYNWNCCGVSLEYRRIVLSSVGRNENEYLFRFNLANLGGFGNLRREERVF